METFRSYILEANLVSKTPLINAIHTLLTNKRVAKQEIVNWFNKQFINWFISPNDDQDKQSFISRYTPQEHDPLWMKNKDIFVFNQFNSEYTDYLNHVIDYLNTLNDIELKSLYKEPYPVIVQKVQKWDEYLKKQQTKKQEDLTEDVDYKVIIDFKDGYQFVELLSQKAYTREGNLMGHCVGDYFEYKDEEGIDIFSLFDKNQQPHCTIETQSRQYIQQIKGKANEAPKEKYIPYIKQFIDIGSFTVVEDGENIGYIKFDGYWYDPESEEGKEIVIKQKELSEKYINSVFKQIMIINGRKTYNGDIHLHNHCLEELPDFSDLYVNGSFNCGNNKLKTLKGAPLYTAKDFTCSSNQLVSLEGCPVMIKGNFDCNTNNLTNLNGISKHIDGSISCAINQLTSLKGIQTKINKGFSCSFNQLTDLTDGPTVVDGVYSCSHNKLTTLKGAPLIHKGNFFFSDNNLQNLDYLPYFPFYESLHQEVTSHNNPGNFKRPDIIAATRIAKKRYESQSQTNESFSSINSINTSMNDTDLIFEAYQKRLVSETVDLGHRTRNKVIKPGTYTIYEDDGDNVADWSITADEKGQITEVVPLSKKYLDFTYDVDLVNKYYYGKGFDLGHAIVASGSCIQDDGYTEPDAYIDSAYEDRYADPQF